MPAGGATAAAESQCTRTLKGECGAPSPFSSVDAATTIVFTGGTLSSVITVKAVHLAELRTAIDAFRAAAGLGAAVFTDSPLADRWLWQLTRHELRDAARFQEEGHRFFVPDKIPGFPAAPTGSYRLVTRERVTDGFHPYRLGHELAQHLVSQSRDRALPPSLIRFDYSGHSKCSIAMPHGYEDSRSKVVRVGL